MIVDAVVLSGGRGARLGGESKAALQLDGVSLLDRTLAACDGVRRVVVVGDAPGRASGTRTISGAEVIVTSEKPPFSGPVAAVAAGLSMTDAALTPDAILLLAVDMPHSAALVPLLLSTLREREGAEAVVARDADGVLQPLAAVYRTEALRRTLEGLAAESSAPHPLAGLPMRAITGRMVVESITAPHGTTDDVDTPADAAALGVVIGPSERLPL